MAIPCHPLTKIPRVRWKLYQTVMPDLELQRAWFSEPCNIAIITTGMVLFDCDDPAKVERVLEECGDTPHRVLSPRGGQHLGYRRRKGVELRNQVDVKDMKIDIRTDGGLEMLPNSRTPDGEYAWLESGLLPASELPRAKISWTRERTKKVLPPIVPEIADGNAILYRGRCYIDTSDERAVSGAGGHTTLFKACLKLVRFVRRLGGSENDIWHLILYFNATKCDPPWRIDDPRELAALQHKFKDALRLAK